MKGKFLVGLVSVLVVGVLLAGPAAAHTPRFFNEASVGTRVPLRSVASLPSIRQPDAIEFNNNGNVTLTLHFLPTKGKGETTTTVVCTEIEFGTTVVTNNLEATEEANKLALPFGVAEGNECKEPPGAPVPTYFDTLATGVVPAYIMFSGEKPLLKASIHNLKLSSVVGGKFCTSTFENTIGEVVDELPGIPEETIPNTHLVFTKAPFTGTCEGKPVTKFNGELTAEFFVETMSTLTDTVWVE